MKYVAYTVLLIATASALSQDAGDKKIYTREDFKKLVFGKLQDEVKEAIGKPNRVTNKPVGNSLFLVWEYDGIVRDKDAKDIDESTWVWFNDYSNQDKQKRVGRVSVGRKPKR